MPYIALLTCSNGSICPFRAQSFIYEQRLTRISDFERSTGSSKLNYQLQPRRNGQAERCNGVIWKRGTMSLKSKNLPLKNWQDALSDVLHSVHSLLCTATNETPPDSFFDFSRRSSTGTSILTWLATSGPLYINSQVCTSKMNPLVNEVELLQADPHYLHVCYPGGRETTVATKHLAPQGHMEVVEMLSAPESIPEEAENLPHDTPKCSCWRAWLSLFCNLSIKPPEFMFAVFVVHILFYCAFHVKLFQERERVPFGWDKISLKKFFFGSL